jgi:hypothetical protein
LIESQKGAKNNFLTRNITASKNLYDLAIVVIGEQANSNLEDQGPTEDNNGINTDDDNVRDHENVSTFNASATESCMDSYLIMFLLLIISYFLCL